MNVKQKPRSCDDLEFRYAIHRNGAVLTWQSQTKKKHSHCIEVSKNAHIYNFAYLFIWVDIWVSYFYGGQCL